MMTEFAKTSLISWRVISSASASSAAWSEILI
jgi:hypothetical protein